MPSRRGSGGGETFEKDAYVMAMWRNQYEYLAKVVGSRQRSREEPEYRLRYIWDGVVEWTHTSRMRRATEKEIHDVERFMRTGSPVASRNAEGGSKNSVDNITAEIGRPKREVKRKSLISDTPTRQPKSATQLDNQGNTSTSSTRRQSISVRKSAAATTPPPIEVKPPPSAPPTVPSGQPVTYPCPFCPRSFRHDRLLNVHLRNYHRGSGSIGSPIDSPSSPIQSKQVPSPNGKRKVNTPSIDSASPKPNPSNSTSHVEGTATETALLRGPEVLVFCAACKFAGPSREPLQNLLQCSVCRVWAHKACVVTTFTSQQESPFVCSTCYRKPSKLSCIAPFANWPEYTQDGEEIRAPSSAVDVHTIRREANHLMSWIRHISQLLNRGQHVMCRIRKTAKSIPTVPTPSATALAINSSEMKSDVSNVDVCATKTGKQDLGIDFPFIPETNGALPGDYNLNAFLFQLPVMEHFGDVSKGIPSQANNGTSSTAPPTTNVAAALEPADISGFLANLASNSPEDLPDLITTIADDLLSVPGQVINSSNPAPILDTPTKALLDNLDQELVPSVGGSKLFQGSASRGSDFPRSFSNDPSPLFTTPIKISLPHHNQQTTIDYEAAASLIGFAESATRGQPNSNGDPVSEELKDIHYNILVPGEEMMTLIENRIKAISSRVAEMVARMPPLSTSPRPVKPRRIHQNLGFPLQISDRIRTTAATTTTTTTATSSNNNSLSEYNDEDDGLDDMAMDEHSYGDDNYDGMVEDNDDYELVRTQDQTSRGSSQYPLPRFAPKRPEPSLF